MNKKIILIILIILIIALYVNSAFNKIINFTKVADSLQKKLTSSVLFNWVPFDISYIGLLFAILLLLLGSGLLLYGVYSEINKYIKYGIILLIIFLILATIIYHPITDVKERNDLLKNLSLIGCLGFIFTLLN